MYTFTVLISNLIHNFTKKEATTNHSGTCGCEDRIEIILIHCHLYLIWSIVKPIQSVKLNIDPWSFIPQTLTLNENHASEKTCGQNLVIFSILFNLHGEEERINIHKRRMFF